LACSAVRATPPIGTPLLRMPASARAIRSSTWDHRAAALVDRRGEIAGADHREVDAGVAMISSMR
jgi:hypothetical protein